MRYRLGLMLWLLVAWVAFWRDVSFANIASGLVLSAGLVWLFPPPLPRGEVRIRPWGMLRFLGASVVSIVRANFFVAWEVVTPTNQINEGVVTVELSSDQPVLITMISHAIILAPGTMVIDIDNDDDDRPPRLYVHVLHLREVEDVRREIQQLEALASAAIAATPVQEEAP